MRLCTRQQYKRMNRDYQRYIGQWIIAEFKLNSVSFARLGITVTKKFGNSPQRHRFKRLVRESFRLSYPSFPLSFDVVVKPRSHALKASFFHIQEELNTFIAQFVNSR